MAGFHNVAKELLKTFGFPITVRNFSKGSFDIEEGERVEVLEKEAEGLCIFTQLDSGALKESGYTYFEGDKKILVNVPLDFNLTITTKIDIQGVIYVVGHIREVKDVLETAIYKLVVRIDKED